jgi:hypothetical protein
MFRERLGNIVKANYILEPFRWCGMQSRWQAKTAFTQPSGQRAEGFELASQFCKEAEVREAICAGLSAALDRASRRS